MASKKMAPGSEKRGRCCGNSADDCNQLASIAGIMNNLRKQGELCDVTLVVQGRHIPAHKVVLAAASQFFRLMFTTEMMESVSHEVELKGAEPEIIELLLDFIYTTRISLNVRNVQPLLQAANQYQIDPVKMMCAEFLSGQIDTTNCLGISAFAEFVYCPELKAKADHFTWCHFAKVSKLDGFLQLDITQVTHLLQQDNLSVSEEQIYQAARRWLMHDTPTRRQYLVKVFSCIRFPLISRTFLSSTVQAEPLIQDDPRCLNMLISGMRYHLLTGKDLPKIQPRLWQTHRITVFSHHSCRYFNPKDSSWTAIHCSLEKRQNAAAAFWEGVVYILGGLCDLTPVKNMDCYNIQEDSWYCKVGLPTPRNRLAACAAHGKIYTSGGAAECFPTLDVFESYDIETDSWQAETRMLVARRCHGSVEVDGLIYVCGGIVGDTIRGRILKKFDVYNPDTKRWSELSAMKTARKNHGLVVVRNRIYAVGGLGPKGMLRSVEFYDIGSNKWCDAAPMPWLGITLKCAAVDNVIYVLAGRQQGGERLQHVLEYHAEADRWVTRSSVQTFPVTNCVICVVGP